MSVRTGNVNLGVREILLLLAIVCFVLDAIADIGGIQLGWLGLAFFAGAFIVPGGLGIDRRL
jgi:hypothetical protein